MRKVISVLVVAAVALAVACGGAVKGGDGSCKKGDRKPAGDGCNTCSCTDDGLWACTEMACTTCIPGTTKPAGDNCNTCTCDANGSGWACTLMACVDPPPTTCPAPKVNGEACDAVIVYAKEPTSGTCCEYSDACHVPVGMKIYPSLDECLSH